MTTPVEPPAIPTCTVCGEADPEPLGDDVVRCRNCGYLWVLAPAS